MKQFSIKSQIFTITLILLVLKSTAFGQTLEIYVSDANNFSAPWKILKFDENGENPQTFINTNLAWPQDIVFLEDQHVVLISNLNSGRITKHNSSTGEYIEDFATGISGPTRMKIGEDSLLYVLQWTGNGRVLRYQLDGTFVDEFTNVRVQQSIGIDWDNEGNLYISSYSGDHVRKFDSNGNDLGLFVDSNLQGPTNIWFDVNGDLLVSDYDGTAVKRFDSTGTYVNDFITGLSNSEGVDFFPNGDILIGNGATSSVKLYDSTGNYIEDFIQSGAGGLVTPNAVVIRIKNAVSVSDPIHTSEMKYELSQNYPNPFNPTTIIKYSVPTTTIVQLSVFDYIGRKVATLVDEVKERGIYSAEFDASEFSSGVYFYKLDAGDYSKVNKMVLLK